MSAIVWGPWLAPPARTEGRPFASLGLREQASLLRYALRDLGRYQGDLRPEDRAWLARQLPPRPVKVSELSETERARVAGAVLLVLRRVGGWA